ncbi:MAG: hypothetical protein KKE24_03350 [Candidatus Thermoplasmatota archaeon]|nr:hypothetical protein [Candidatus Thermoplasmatota archaeon]
MSEYKWVEVNIHLRNAGDFDRVLLGFVKNYVNEVKERAQERRQDMRWHFLREECPVLEPKTPEIRLRFYGVDSDIAEIRIELEERLKGISDPSPHFGAHGKPGDDYTGEEGSKEKGDGFGQEGWPIFMKYLQDCSETALKLLEKEPRTTSERPWEFYIERFMHLSLNQIGIHTYLANRDSGGNIFVPFLNHDRWLLVPLK